MVEMLRQRVRYSLSRVYKKVTQIFNACVKEKQTIIKISFSVSDNAHLTMAGKINKRWSQEESVSLLDKLLKNSSRLEPVQSAVEINEIQREILEILRKKSVK